MEESDITTGMPAASGTAEDPPLAGHTPPSASPAESDAAAAEPTASPAMSETSKPNAGNDEWMIDVPNEVDIESDNASRPPQGEADASAMTATIDITFVDFGFEPINGLHYKLKAGDTIIRGATDATGKVASLTDIMPGSEVEIFVAREHTKDYKRIGSLYAHSGWTGYTIVSPKIRFEIETETHFGEPGDAEKNLPPVPPKAADTVPQAPELPATPASTGSPGTTAAAKSPVAATVKPERAHPSSTQAKAPTATSAKQDAVARGRDARGNPQATVQDSTLDWLKRKILFVFNFWHWKDFQPPATTVTTSPPAPAQGHPKVNPLRLPAVAANGELSNADLARLHALIQFAENQVKLDYSAYRGSGGTTANVLKEYAKDQTPSFAAKMPEKPMGLCQVYVKVALFKAGYTNGPGWEAQAKTSGRDWLTYGFTDVSHSLPQIEIAYEGAMAAADLAKAQLVLKRTAALQALQAERRKKKDPMTAEESAAAEKDIPAMPQKTVARYTQPDLMYTLPGDVIVYEQVDPVELDPAGHVDIRTYHGFVSDFAWPRNPSLGGPPARKRYRVIGVYRKMSDVLAIARVNAFLKIIRAKETEGFLDDESYFVLPDGKGPNGKPLKRKFSDTSTHPFSATAKEVHSRTDFYGKVSTAAGAYQILFDTWKEVIKETGWPAVFTPEMQTRIALYLLRRRIAIPEHPKRNALGYILEGRIEEAIERTKLWKEWSCLPNGLQPKYTMPQLKKDFEKYMEEFIK